MSVHSKFAPSSAEQWINCPGSVPLQASMPDEQDKYAKEGDAAHALAEAVLINDFDATDLIGETVKGHEITKEMAEAVQVFVDECRRVIESLSPEATHAFETRLISSFNTDYGGTLDFRAHDPAHKRLVIVDYKHGAGKFVEVVDNAQLLSYALIAWRGEQEVELIVVQPRFESITDLFSDEHGDSELGVRRFTIDADTLADFREKVEGAFTNVSIAEARLLVESVDEAKDCFKTGDHCQWCTARAICPAQQKEVFEDALGDLPPVISMTPDRLAELLHRIPQIEAYLKALKAHVRNQMMGGKIIPGYKLVQSYKNREWNLSDEDVLKKLRSKKVKKADATRVVLKSPAQIEKLDKALKPLVATLTSREPGSVSIKPADSKGETYVPPSTTDMFSAVEDSSTTTEQEQA